MEKYIINELKMEKYDIWWICLCDNYFVAMYYAFKLDWNVGFL